MHSITTQPHTPQAIVAAWTGEALSSPSDIITVAYIIALYALTDDAVIIRTTRTRNHLTLSIHVNFFVLMGRFPGETLDGSSDSREHERQHRWVEERNTSWKIPIFPGTTIEVLNPWQCLGYIDNIAWFQKYVCLYSRHFVGALAHVSQAYVEIVFLLKKYCESDKKGKVTPVPANVYVSRSDQSLPQHCLTSLFFRTLPFMTASPVLALDRSRAVQGREAVGKGVSISSLGVKSCVHHVLPVDLDRASSHSLVTSKGATLDATIVRCSQL
jgi:hypothetical protein